MYGVIFDVDGVLVDSYAAHRTSWCDLAQEYGVTFGDREFAATFGRTSAAILKEYWPPMSDDEARTVDDRKEALYRAIIEYDFPAMPGAKELIAALHDDGWGLAAGSSGPPENVAMVINRLGATKTITAIVTGRDVRRGKPDPEVFYCAADRLGLSPHQCVVVEDAPAGVAAARAAGMRCVGFASTGRTAEELADADHVIHSLRELGSEQLRGMLSGRD